MTEGRNRLATTRGSRAWSRRSRSLGLTMVEVLVTLVVVAIGLLGIAGLQVSALKLGFVAENRSNGVVFATNILDRMRINSADIGAYAIAFGGTAPTGSTQAAIDLADFKTQVAAFLPGGDTEITVAQGDATSCDVPAIAKCWDVLVSLRWNESNVKGGNTGSAQTFLKMASRI